MFIEGSTKMISKKFRLIALGLIVFGVISALCIFLSNANLDVLNPKGEIANKQRDLIVLATVLSAIVVLPVFVLTFFIGWRYKESNKKAKYTPEWGGSKILESIWWGIPIILILILSIITFKSSHDLDPFKPIQSAKKPVTIQVVALQWKWLFIYPEEGIATVNYVEFPVDTPINFEITADAPMNSFWIPQLGGQIYAMSGMSTHLNLIANETGSYDGSSANISGEGFSSMKFVAKATTRGDFDRWVDESHFKNNVLGQTSYAELAKPSANEVPTVYSDVDPELYTMIMKKYVASGHRGSHAE